METILWDGLLSLISNEQEGKKRKRRREGGRQNNRREEKRHFNYGTVLTTNVV